MKILTFGATGYVGGHVAGHLARSGHVVTAAVRANSNTQSLQQAGIDALVVDLSDDPQLATLGRDHDAVVWAAQLMLEDELRVVQALLRNLEGTGKAFVFTSGTSLLSERTDGDWSENTYAEDDTFVPRRQVAPRLDIENIVRAATSRGVRAMAIRPPLIWGHGGNKVLADLFYSAHKTGAVCYVGRGLNLYSNVHVDDLAEIYRLALEKGVGGALYHAVSGEANYRTLAEAIARQLGVGTRSITVVEAAELWDKFMGPIVFAGCSRTRCPRTRRELGWVPDPARLDILDDLAHPRYADQKERGLPAWVRPAA